MPELNQTSRHAVLDLVQLIADLNLSARHYRSYQRYLTKQINLIEDQGAFGEELYVELLNIKGSQDLTEKQSSQLEALSLLIEKYNQLETVRKEILTLRRNYMSELGNGFRTDPKMWCSCKHMFDAFTLAEEVTNAVGNEGNLLLASYEEQTFRLMLKTLSLYLGYEPMDCESCLTDQIVRDEDTVLVSKIHKTVRDALKDFTGHDIYFQGDLGATPEMEAPSVHPLDEDYAGN